jgi:hypothetical protein
MTNGKHRILQQAGHFAKEKAGIFIKTASRVSLLAGDKAAPRYLKLIFSISGGLRGGALP